MTFDLPDSSYEDIVHVVCFGAFSVEVFEFCVLRRELLCRVLAGTLWRFLRGDMATSDRLRALAGFASDWTGPACVRGGFRRDITYQCFFLFRHLTSASMRPTARPCTAA